MRKFTVVLIQYQDQFSVDPKVQALLKRVRLEKARRRQHDEAYYHDDQLDELLQRPLDGEMADVKSELHLNGNGATVDAH